MVKKYSPFKDWNWDKEMQSQILRAVDNMTTVYINSNRKKGSKKLKPPELVQPDYVKKAKKKLGEDQKNKAREKQEELAEFFEKRNRIMKEKNNDE
jgi:S-adenosylmethionine synthetase